MAQLSFEDLVNGTVPDASDFNSRFNALKNRINNGMESDNIADNSITTGKINNDAVTLGKLAHGTLGGIPYFAAAGTPTELAGNTTTTQKFLSQTGNGSVSAVPSWEEIRHTIVQVVNFQTGSVATGSTAIPDDDSIPESDEGDQYMSLEVTPTSATNKLKIDIVFQYELNGATAFGVALFQDLTVNALASQYFDTSTNLAGVISYSHYMTAGTTSATTFKVRAGGASGTTTFNGNAGARKHGGVLASSITITEIKV